MSVSVKLTRGELETLLICVSDYRWSADFPNGELEKMKRKLKYHNEKYNEKSEVINNEKN